MPLLQSYNLPMTHRGKGTLGILWLAGAGLEERQGTNSSPRAGTSPVSFLAVRAEKALGEMFSRLTCLHTPWLRVPSWTPRKEMCKACLASLADFLLGQIRRPEHSGSEAYLADRAPPSQSQWWWYDPAVEVSQAGTPVHTSS